MVAIEPSKTQRLYLLLKEQILSGALPPGHRLPSEPTLATEHRLSRVTIRRALDGLAREGLIRRQPGSGTFVLDISPRKSVVGDLANMLAHLAAMGRATRVKLLSFRYAMPPLPVAEALKLAEGDKVQHSVRVRYVDGTPFSHLTTYVPDRIGMHYSETELASTPLLELLERAGIKAEKASQSITATLAGPEIAAALGIEIGSPLLAMTRVVFDAEGRGIEYLSALYRPDQYAFHMDLTRTGMGADRQWSPLSNHFAPASGRRPAGHSRRRP